VRMETETASVWATAISGAALGAVVAMVIGPNDALTLLLGAVLGAAAGALLGKIVLSIMLR
jgi:outer membrane lipoprotein SlyB